VKTLSLILVCLSLMAQSRSSPTPGNGQKVINPTTEAATVAALQAQIAQLSANKRLDATATAITTACPSCLSSLARILNGATPGQYTSMVLCCGAITVPPTPRDSRVLYILQAAGTLASGNPGAADSPHN
jgi:hypothetical protein